MSQSNFLRVFKDAGAEDELLSSTRIDIIFNKIKVKGQSKIEYPQFLEGALIASRTKKCDLDELGKSLRKL